MYTLCSTRRVNYTDTVYVLRAIVAEIEIESYRMKHSSNEWAIVKQRIEGKESDRLRELREWLSVGVRVRGEQVSMID